jgi:hypothetical protein
MRDLKSPDPMQITAGVYNEQAAQPLDFQSTVDRRVRRIVTDAL